MATKSCFDLEVMEGQDKGVVARLDETTTTRIVGQSPACAIRLSDPKVASRHLSLEVTNDRLRLLDLGSPDGVFVNGVQVREAFLAGGETIRTGNTVMVVTRPGQSVRPMPESESVQAVAPMTQQDSDVLQEVLSSELPFTQARELVVAAFEKRYVSRILAKHNGNVTAAAASSGLAHRYFQILKARQNRPRVEA